MTDATDLFEHVKTVYDSDGLITLTNIRDRSATSIDENVGDLAAQSVIDLWPAYTQVAYDATNGLHEEVATEALIALLWKRGGSASSIAEVKWSEVVEMFDRVKNTGPRGRRVPKTNGPDKNTAGSNLKPWSHDDHFPDLPTRRLEA